jgi:8-oxo-dGTP pyrophosphatase MutT (NUDIX family)
MKAAKRGTVQLAALPWRNQGRLEMLLITSRETRRWVIPKGWPMKGLSAPEAAAREAFEEAGVKGEVDPLAIGYYAYEKLMGDGSLRPLDVDVFALRVTELLDEWPEKGQRERRWFTPPEAAEAVDEADLRKIIAGFRV